MADWMMGEPTRSESGMPSGVNAGGAADPLGSVFNGGFGEVQNSYASPQYQRQRQMTLGDLLLENRIVFLQGEIHTGNANELVMKLLYLQSENRKKPIHFYINSPGGSVTAGLSIYDTMQFIKPDVSTLCIGQAASMGAFLLCSGAEGKRFMLPNARTMIHQPSGGAQGQASDISIQAEEILKIRSKLNGLMASHTGQPLETIERDTERDTFMSAEESKEYGLIDDVLESRPTGE